MIALANRFYPTWRTKVISHETIRDSSGILIYEKSVIELQWEEDHLGQVLSKSIVESDAEMIQYKKNTDVADGRNIVNLGFHSKGCITRVMKKAFNVGMNICDDMYFAKTPFLSDEELEVLSEKLKNSDRAKSDDPRQMEFIQAVMNEIDEHRNMNNKRALSMNREKFMTLIKQIQ